MYIVSFEDVCYINSRRRLEKYQFLIYIECMQYKFTFYAHAVLYKKNLFFGILTFVRPALTYFTHCTLILMLRIERDT